MEIRNYICSMPLRTLIASGCKKPYSPPAIAADNNYLVVEGGIDVGADSTVINLSRTVNLSGQTKKNSEKKSWDPVSKDSTYGVQVGYYDCVDCRYHLNGKTKKPAFWR